MSKGFYLGSIVGGWIVAFVLSAVAGVMAVMEGVTPGSGSSAAPMALSVVVSIYLIVVNMILWYRAWKSIQEYGSRTSPGMAIGFLFIPIYNFYWVFQAFWGFAKDFNSNIEAYSLSIPRLSEGLYLAYTIIVVLTGVLFWVPFLNLLLGITNIVLTALVVNKLVDAVNNIRQAPLPERRGLVY
jgi:hypothetical protein